MKTNRPTRQFPIAAAAALFCGLLAAPAAFCDSATPNPSDKGTTSQATPTTRPAVQNADQAVQIKELITQLGDDRYRTREDAAKKLKEIGKPALPALKEAASDPSPEVQNRAKKLADDIESPPRPPTQEADGNGNGNGNGRVFIGPGGRIVLNGGAQMIVHANAMAAGNANVRMTMTNINGNSVKDVDANENGRHVHIHEDKDGLVMSVTEKDAKEPTEYKAKDADDLKQKDPEAFKTYEKYAGNGGINAAIHFGPAVRPLPPQKEE